MVNRSSGIKYGGNETEGVNKRKILCSESCENLNADPTRN